MPPVRMTIGLASIRSFKRISYSPWHALAEFVDNSTQSYFDHKDVLDKEYAREESKLTVAIDYDHRAGVLRIADNAMGMSFAELRRALVIGEPPPPPRYRSQYGLGLKTAASWFGNVWTVETKRLGSRKRYVAKVDVEKIARGKSTVPVEASTQSTSDHFTVVQITELNRPIHGRTRDKIRDFLRSMYRKDIRDGLLTLKWMNQELTWDQDLVFAKDVDGTEYQHSFVFRVRGKRVSGWAGVLEKGSRAKAGFSILHAGRVVKGWPEAWRPEAVYGQPGGSNNLVNQRVVGEIDLGAFAVSHTKDDILWLRDEQAEVEEKLRAKIEDLIDAAAEIRRPESAVPSATDTRRAAVQLQKSIASPELARWWLDASRPPKAYQTRASKLLAGSTRRAPDFTASADGLTISGYLATDLTPDDQYLITDSPPGALVIVINLRHPFVLGMKADVLLRHLEHSASEALARQKLDGSHDGAAFDAFEHFKDGVLRIVAKTR